MTSRSLLVLEGQQVSVALRACEHSSAPSGDTRTQFCINHRVLEVATGSSGKKKSSTSSDRSTDWATRAPAAPRKRRSS